MNAPPVTWADVVPAVAAALETTRVKLAADGLPVLSQAADAIGWRAGPVNAFYGGPRPLTNTLVGAGLGAILGYGGGLAAEQLFPEGTFEPGTPRRRFALAGGLLGAAPGLYQGYDNLRTGHGLLDPWPPLPQAPDPTPGAAAIAGGPAFAKPAADNDFLFAPAIPRERFQAAVFADPNTPPHLQAATAGLVEAASRVSGRPVVTPWDVARIALGAGTGLASGYLVGKTLGLLAGLSPDRQRELQQTGAWAGALKAVVPQALGFA